MFMKKIAPFTGVWIETFNLFITAMRTIAPFTGVWIETNSICCANVLMCRALHGRVD